MKVLGVIVVIIACVLVFFIDTRTFFRQLAKLNQTVCPKCKKIGTLEPLVPTIYTDSTLLPEEARQMVCRDCGALVPFDQVAYLPDQDIPESPKTA